MLTILEWVDSLENVAPAQKDFLKDTYDNVVLEHARQQFVQQTDILYPFKWINRVCEKKQQHLSQRHTATKKQSGPKEYTSEKNRIWHEYDYDLPPTVTPFATFEDNEKKWYTWLDSRRGQNYLLLYGQPTVNKAREKFVARTKEWHDDPEGCIKVISDFPKGIFTKTIHETANALRDTDSPRPDTTQQTIYNVLNKAAQSLKETSNLDGDERKEEGPLFTFDDV